MAKTFYNQELITKARAAGRLPAEKALADKRIGGKIHGWKVSSYGEYEGHSNVVVIGSVTEDGHWGDSDSLRTSLIVSIDRESGVLETLNTVYTLVGEENQPKTVDNAS